MYYTRLIREKNIRNIYELLPRDSRKSFYGKAKVLIDEKGNEYLQSYETIVMARIDGQIVKLWDGWSATTGRHIASFCGLNKAELDKLPCVSI